MNRDLAEQTLAAVCAAVAGLVLAMGFWIIGIRRFVKTQQPRLVWKVIAVAHMLGAIGIVPILVVLVVAVGVHDLFDFTNSEGILLLGRVLGSYFILAALCGLFWIVRHERKRPENGTR
ncbi:MAG: hypothetical protein J2P46_11875 [Zavarzinella sp.]|nr:hypothetical protein [Zavarzinella sp.]